MKKRSFNAADVFMILILVACVVGIAVRAFSLADAETEKFRDYRVKFTAKLDEKQLEAVTAGVVLKDENKTEFKLLEGYWITKNGNSSLLNGELLVSGKITEKGFETNGGFYYKNDVVTLQGDGLGFDASVLDFIQQ